MELQNNNEIQYTQQYIYGVHPRKIYAEELVCILYITDNIVAVVENIRR